MGRKDNQKENETCIISAFKDDAVEVSDKDEDEVNPVFKKDKNKTSFLDDIGLLAELKKMSMTEDTSGKVIDGHERYNVDV